MKTVIKRVGGGPLTLEEFATQHGLTMEVCERSISDYPTLPRYSAIFDDVEELGDHVLTSACGNGATPEEAIADYAKRIRGRRLVIHAYSVSGQRREFQAPNEWLA